MPPESSNFDGITIGGHSPLDENPEEGTREEGMGTSEEFKISTSKKSHYHKPYGKNHKNSEEHGPVTTIPKGEVMMELYGELLDGLTTSRSMVLALLMTGEKLTCEKMSEIISHIQGKDLPRGSISANLSTIKGTPIAADLKITEAYFHGGRKVGAVYEWVGPKRSLEDLLAIIRKSNAEQSRLKRKATKISAADEEKQDLEPQDDDQLIILSTKAAVDLIDLVKLLDRPREEVIEKCIGKALKEVNHRTKMIFDEVFAE